MRHLFRLTPASIAIFYLFLSVIWIIATDVILIEYISQLEQYQLWQSYKGLFFVCGTGAVIYFLVRSYSNRIQKNEYQLKIAEEVAGLGHWFFDLDTNRIEWGEQTYRLFGVSDRHKPLTREEILDRIHPDDRKRINEAIREALQKGTPYNMNIRAFTNSTEKTYRYLNTQCEAIKNDRGKVTELYGTVLDITRQVARERELEQSLEEKNILIQEIHHRVKNNLAIISGLLQLQILNSEDKTLHAILEDSLMRIYSIALVHERLYKSGDFTNISNHRYLAELVDRIEDTFADSNKKIIIEQNIEDFSININQAIPCAMLVNELILNAYRHAFKDRPQGRIAIEMEQEGNSVHLRVRDDGVGLPEDFSLDQTSSLGSKLIQLLTKQLHGEIDFESQPGKGTTFHISFERAERSGSSSLIEN